MNQLAVTLVVLLLPGIIAAIIFDKITSHSKWDAFKFGVYSLVLGVFCYAILQFAWWTVDLAMKTSSPVAWTVLAIWSSALKTEASLKGVEVCLALALSVPVAYAASYTVNHKVFNKLAQHLRVSQKFGDENLFSYFLNRSDVEWVYVRDREAELTYSGSIVSFAENASCHEIVLSDVRVYEYETSEFLYKVSTVYLCRPIGTIVVEAIADEDLEDE